MRNSTLLFLVKKEGGVITEVCLPMKKRGFGMGRYNGVGGKVEPMETIETAVLREAKEEIGVDVGDVIKCAELAFTFPHKEEWNQFVHVYLAESWEGDIVETEEMKPYWFTVGRIPYNEMWPDDIFWLPKVLEGNLLKGEFTFSEGDVIEAQEVNIVSAF